MRRSQLRRPRTRVRPGSARAVPSVDSVPWRTWWPDSFPHTTLTQIHKYTKSSALQWDPRNEGRRTLWIPNRNAAFSRGARRRLAVFFCPGHYLALRADLLFPLLVRRRMVEGDDLKILMICGVAGSRARAVREMVEGKILVLFWRQKKWYGRGRTGMDGFRWPCERESISLVLFTSMRNLLPSVDPAQVSSFGIAAFICKRIVGSRGLLTGFLKLSLRMALG